MRRRISEGLCQVGKRTAHPPASMRLRETRPGRNQPQATPKGHPRRASKEYRSHRLAGGDRQRGTLPRLPTLYTADPCRHRLATLVPAHVRRSNRPDGSSRARDRVYRVLPSARSSRQGGGLIVTGLQKGGLSRLPPQGCDKHWTARYRPHGQSRSPRGPSGAASRPPLPWPSPWASYPCTCPLPWPW